MSWGLGSDSSRDRKPPATVKTYKVLMSFQYENGWRCTFFMDDRSRTALPRRAFIRTDEDLFDFIRRGGGTTGSDDRVYMEAAIQRQHGEVTLSLSEEQYQALHGVNRPSLRYNKLSPKPSFRDEQWTSKRNRM